MIRLWKETLLPGTQVDARSKRKFTITDDDVRAGRRNINRMVKKGRKIPLVFEHQNVEENDPEEWKANYARNTFGQVGGARLSTTDDVSKGLASRPGTLLVAHDIYDEASAAAVKRAGYVSPKIYRGYEDSQGEEYDGLTVAHIAATPTACQFWQQPFQLSEDEVVYLSYTPPEEDDEDFLDTEEVTECPDYANDFTAWLDECIALSAYSEEGSTVAEEPKKKEPDGDEDAGGGAGAEFKELVKVLKAKGLTISDKVSNVRELIIAADSAPSIGGGDVTADEVVPENPDEGGSDATAAAGGPPMMMSTLDKDPNKRKRAIKEAEEERKDATKRITALFDTGRIDGPKKRALLRVATGTEMSFTATGEAGGKHWTPVVTSIAELEKLAPNTAWKANGKTDIDGLLLSVVDPPDFANRADSPTPGQTDAAKEMERISVGYNTAPAKK